MTLYGSVEAGGTKFVCAVAEGPAAIHAMETIPTTTPEETLIRVADWFRSYQRIHGRSIDALGIGCFGPLDLDKSSGHYGCITQTPKAGWIDTSVAGFFEQSLKMPVGIDTDVNAAVYGECLWGAGKGLDVVIYLTVGTGIGGGLYVHDRPIHGMLHPEMGHVMVQKHPDLDTFAGACPYHQSCLEGLASGRAVDLRWCCHASELPDDHPAWELEADYLAQGLVSFILTVSPQRIILGGGLMHKTCLYPLIRNRVRHLLNGYLAVDRILNDIDHYIVPPGLGTRSGICGAIRLAMQAFDENEDRKK